MNPEKNISDLKQSINETMESIRSIKGEQYVQILHFLNHATNMSKICAVCSVEAPPELRDILGRAVAQTVTLACELIFDAYNFSEEQEAEIMDWMMKISDRVDYTAENLRRH